MTDLDQNIHSALASLNSPTASRTFNAQEYIQAFQDSAKEKAEAVLDLLNGEKSLFRGRRPVFVSIGGGDGSEIEYLLRNSNAPYGILIEMVHGLASEARKRNDNLPDDKTLEVYEGDAQDKIGEAIEHAVSIVTNGMADYVAVTCHAIIHELFDRGRDEFDPLGFFASIFSRDTISLWFTYREPGIPEKWPESVLIGANSSPNSLLLLAEAICARHLSLRKLSPSPQIVGDRVRLNRILAMELIAKLFYLPDLNHEIQERSTAVNHTTLTNTLWLAIGETAKVNNRAHILSSSAPTKSFSDLWQKYGITVTALNESNMTMQLGIAESQTRLVAWRLSSDWDAQPAKNQQYVTGHKRLKAKTAATSEVIVANEALEAGDDELLCAILLSKGRAWIESARKDQIIKLLYAVKSKYQQEHLAHLWSHYLISIASLFEGAVVSAETFSEELEKAAGAVGLGLLFRAERMEFNRKLDKDSDAVQIANTLIPLISDFVASKENSLTRYCVGACYFLLANLLRHGGQYQHAWSFIDQAQNAYKPGIESHDTELAHCYYAKGVCTAMTGVSTFDAPFDNSGENNRKFATALIQLSYSHAAWFIDDVTRSKQHALAAAEIFTSIGTPRYAERARHLEMLLQWWEALSNNQTPNLDGADSTLAQAVTILSGADQNVDWLLNWLPSLRPSTILGLLQFGKQFNINWAKSLKVFLPRFIDVQTDESLKWRDIEEVQSLKELDMRLRHLLNIPIDRRVPLLAD